MLHSYSSIVHSTHITRSGENRIQFFCLNEREKEWRGREGEKKSGTEEGCFQKTFSIGKVAISFSFEVVFFNVHKKSLALLPIAYILPVFLFNNNIKFLS